ncbi:barstar family protein [Nocardioides sp. InS609-2]|uniref:barstar family protein n=1 Tax=Nocardioides sp. InS609-2 TaxID=2760705 RepID=UPI0020BEA28C|nr:barstar family protein [Nocardioides sp. InS609-2]
MSGLAALLAGHTPAGIYTWHGAFPAADVQHTVEHAGWRFARLDGVGTESKQEFLEGIGQALGFPDYYGQNFDALADLLSDVDGGDQDGVVLLWEGWAPFARADERAFSVALSVLGTRVNAERGGPFSVLLRGEGPDVPGVSSLD